MSPRRRSSRPPPHRSPLAEPARRRRRRRDRHRARRQRLGLLAVLALAAFGTGAAIAAGGGGSGEGDDEGGAGQSARAGDPQETAGGGGTARALVDRLGLDQQVGQLIVLRFQGTEPPDYVRRILRQGRAAGAILFGDNIVDPEQLRRLTRDLQRAGAGSVLIATDQEGGSVRNVPWAAPETPAPAQATPDVARAAALETGRDLRAAGINIDLAPVADVAAPGTALEGRAYPGGPDEVAALVSAAVDGLDRARVGATPKHFPGLGRAAANTDDAAVTIDAAASELRAELEPFRAAIEAGAPLVMVGHASYPTLDSERIASQSRRIVDGLLRDDLGFDGVVVTDSMEAQAVLDSASFEQAAQRSIDAGADLLLTTGAGSWRRSFLTLRDRARADRAFRDRIRESAARVLTLKDRLSLDPPPAAAPGQDG